MACSCADFRPITSKLKLSICSRMPFSRVFHISCWGYKVWLAETDMVQSNLLSSGYDWSESEYSVLIFYVLDPVLWLTFMHKLNEVTWYSEEGRRITVVEKYHFCLGSTRSRKAQCNSTWLPCHIVTLFMYCLPLGDVLNCEPAIHCLCLNSSGDPLEPSSDIVSLITLEPLRQK